MAPPKTVCKFQPSWLIESCPYHSWVEKARNETDAFCKLCKKVINLSHMGESALRSHQGSAKHKLHMTAVRASLRIDEMFCKPQDTHGQSSSSATLPPVEQSAPTSLNVHSIAFKQFKVKEAVTQSEVLWCLNVVMSHASLRGGSDSVSLFSRMFPDSDIASQMTLGKDKISYTVTHGIAPYFASDLLNKINQCNNYVILFDESLNKVAQRGQMDLHIRFRYENKIVTRYLTSVFLSRTRAEDLLSAFERGTKDLDPCKFLQISMDGPNVNLKFLRLFNNSRNDSTAPPLLDCGTCSLHVVCGSLKTADEKSDYWHVGRFLRCCYYIFHNSPLRRALFLQLNDTSESPFPMKFCATRWVENAAVATRILGLIPKLKVFVEGLAQRREEPKSHSYVMVKNALNDKILPVKVAFFNYIAITLEPFLTSYQTDAPMVPFMYEDLSGLLRELLSKIVKEEFLSGKSPSQMSTLDLSKEAVLKSAESIDLGFAVRDEIKKHRDQLTTADLKKFRKECRSFFITVVNKLTHKCPLGKKIVKGVNCLNPMTVVDKARASSLFDLTLQELVSIGRLDGNLADKIKIEYQRVIKSPDVQEKCQKFTRKTRLDAFWSNILEEKKVSSEFQKLVFTLLCLSHGQATVERGFNINKELLDVNQKENSLIAQRVVHDAVSSSGVKLNDMELPKGLLQSARNARRCYNDYLEENKKNTRKEQLKAQDKRKIAAIVKDKESEFKRFKTANEQQMQRMEEQIISLKDRL